MMRVAVVRFPGSNCEPEACRAIERAGGEAFYLRHRESALQDADAVLLPGGFSYGDYLRSGAIARFSPIMEAIRRHAAAGGPVLGICTASRSSARPDCSPAPWSATRRSSTSPGPSTCGSSEPTRPSPARTTPGS